MLNFSQFSYIKYVKSHKSIICVELKITENKRKKGKSTADADWWQTFKNTILFSVDFKNIK